MKHFSFSCKGSKDMTNIIMYAEYYNVSGTLTLTFRHQICGLSKNMRRVKTRTNAALLQIHISEIK